MIGKTISHYKILEKLGQGGMGVVYKAEDTRLKRSVALKFLPQAFTADPVAKERFIQEAQAASALEHPNICNIHEINETDDGQLYIVMACYEGQTLKERLAAGALPVAETIDVARQIAEGMAEAHEKGIVHRDIKPANIMITEKGQIKIMDFGLAKLAGQMKVTKSGTPLGTAPYMSPEQTRGEKVDHRSDIWSLGVVIYEMLTGELPFRGDYEQAIIYSILNESPEPPAGLRTTVPVALERIIFKCLEKKASKRYQHFDELIVDLRKAGGLAATPAGTRRKSLKPVLLLLPIIILLLFASYFLLSQGGDTSDKSIAVLPLQNLSAGGENAYFAAGLHDELLTQLAKVADLKVISHTSVMGYAGTTKNIRQIAGDLDVANIVEGSVQVIGERLRVNVQLIKASTDGHLWAEHYDRTLDDAFAIQSDIAQQIVAAIGATLSHTEKQELTAAPTTNSEAYQLYLQSREYALRPGFLRKNLEIAQELCQRALTLDPQFALGHATLSRIHGAIYWFRYDPSPERALRTWEEAETALRLAPDLPQAHISLGLAHYWDRRDWRRALAEFAVALEKAPNDAFIWTVTGNAHRRLGNWNEAITAFGKAMRLSPRDANLIHDQGGGTLAAMHRYAEAVAEYDRALRLAPDLYAAASDRGWVYVRWLGQLDTLQALYRRMPRDQDNSGSGYSDTELCEFLFWRRQPDSLLKALEAAHFDITERRRPYLRFLYAALAHQMRGERMTAAREYATALTNINAAIRESPDEWHMHADRGLILTGMGRGEEALAEAYWLQQSRIYREDALEGPDLAEHRAQILAQAGEASAALAEIEKLLTRPSKVTVHTLKLNPRWDPIRHEPRFKELLKKYARD